MVSKTKRIHNSFWRDFPSIAKQMPSKVLFVGRKTRRPFGHLRAKIVIVDTVQSYARLLLCLIENRVPCKIGIRIPKPARMLAIHAWLLCKHCECVIVVLERPVSPWFTYNLTVSNSASVVSLFRAKYCCHLAQYCVHRVWNINCRTTPYTTYELPSIICSHAQNTAPVSQK